MIVNREDLKAFVDDELSAAASKAIQDEIQIDPELAQEVAFLKLLGKGIRECAVEPQVTGAEEVLRRFHHPRLSSWPFFALAGLSVSLVLFAIFPNMRHSEISNNIPPAMVKEKAITKSQTSEAPLSAYAGLTQSVSRQALASKLIAGEGTPADSVSGALLSSVSTNAPSQPKRFGKTPNPPHFVER